HDCFRSAVPELGDVATRSDDFYGWWGSGSFTLKRQTAVSPKNPNPRAKGRPSGSFLPDFQGGVSGTSGVACIMSRGDGHVVARGYLRRTGGRRSKEVRYLIVARIARADHHRQLGR